MLKFYLFASCSPFMTIYHFLPYSVKSHFHLFWVVISGNSPILLPFGIFILFYVYLLAIMAYINNKRLTVDKECCEMEESFGIYLKHLREQKGLTINQLAASAGISGSQISRIENGVRGIPKPATLRKIAEATDVPYEALMERAGYLPEAFPIDEERAPAWATSKDKRDFRKMLEDDGELMFDGIPLNQEDKQRIKDVLTGLFWEAKQMNKRNKSKSDPQPGK